VTGRDNTGDVMKDEVSFQALDEVGCSVAVRVLGMAVSSFWIAVGDLSIFQEREQVSWERGQETILLGEEAQAANQHCRLGIGVLVGMNFVVSSLYRWRRYPRSENHGLKRLRRMRNVEYLVEIGLGQEQGAGLWRQKRTWAL
jgi:hypothetical protein